MRFKQYSFSVSLYRLAGQWRSQLARAACQVRPSSSFWNEQIPRPRTDDHPLLCRRRTNRHFRRIWSTPARLRKQKLCRHLRNGLRDAHVAMSDGANRGTSFTVECLLMIWTTLGAVHLSPRARLRPPNRKIQLWSGQRRLRQFRRAENGTANCKFWLC